RGVELSEDLHPKQLAVDPDGRALGERGLEVVSAGAVGSVSDGSEAGDTGEHEAGGGAQQGAWMRDRDQGPPARPRWSSMGWPCGVARAAASHSAFRWRSSSTAISPFSATRPSSAVSQWW